MDKIPIAQPDQLVVSSIDSEEASSLSGYSSSNFNSMSLGDCKLDCVSAYH